MGHRLALMETNHILSGTLTVQKRDDQQKRPTCSDPYGLHAKLLLGRTKKRDLRKFLEGKGMKRSPAYREIEKHEKAECVKLRDRGYLVDAMLCFSSNEQPVVEAIGKIVDRESLGFFGDAVLKDYAFGRVAQQLGYAPDEKVVLNVIARLGHLAMELGYDKGSFFHALGLKRQFSWLP